MRSPRCRRIQFAAEPATFQEAPKAPHSSLALRRLSAFRLAKEHAAGFPTSMSPTTHVPGGCNWTRTRAAQTLRESRKRWDRDTSVPRAVEFAIETDPTLAMDLC